MPKGWEWDETLYAGSAAYYVRGRAPYAPGLVDRVAKELALDGTGRLLDLGCGPGVVTLLLAPHVAEALGVDPDAGMLAEAARRAEAAGVANVRWLQARAEDLPDDLEQFRVATFAQSFHWMDRPRVAALVRRLLEPGGALVHISDAKEPRLAPSALPHPAPPYAEIAALVRRWLGPVRRAGQGVLRHGSPSGEAAIFRAAGFDGPERLLVPAGRLLLRGIDDVVAWVYSLSYSAPHLFGDDRDAFEAELRALLAGASVTGMFAEPAPDTEVFIWRCPASR
jgi:SAM-dependent methyltransferase